MWLDIVGTVVNGVFERLCCSWIKGTLNAMEAKDNQCGNIVVKCT